MRRWTDSEPSLINGFRYYLPMGHELFGLSSVPIRPESIFFRLDPVSILLYRIISKHLTFDLQ